MKHVAQFPVAVRAQLSVTRTRGTFAIHLLGILALSGALFCYQAPAQTPPPTPPAVPPMAMATPPPAASAPPAIPVTPLAPTPAPAKERTVYVPFERLELVFENEGRGVFLPYREFLDLWNKLKLPEDVKKKEPPVDGVLASAHYSGRVEGDAASISANLELEALKEGWSALKIGTGDWSIADVKSNATLNHSGNGYDVIFPNKGKYDLRMTILGRIKREAGRSSLHLNLPRTVVSQFEMVIPEKGLEFTMTPACAFTTLEQPDGSTKLAVYFGASEEVDIAWQKKAGETALTPLLFAETSAAMKLSAGALRTAYQVQFRILRAGVSAFELLVPAGQAVLNVDGQNLRDWTIETTGSAQKLKVNLHTPARDSYSLQINVESAIASLPAKVPVPSLEVKNAERQSGVLTIAADPDMVIEAGELQGLTQQSALAEKDRALVGQYRYLRLPYAGTLSVSEAKPVVEVTSNTMLTVEPDTLKLLGTFKYSVKKAGIFSTQIALPAGFDQAEATGGEIESAVVQTSGAKKVLNVTFTSRRTGSFSFQVTAEAPRKNAVDPLTAPAFAPQNVARHEAVLGIAIHVSLKANTTDFGDMRQQDIRQIADIPLKNAEVTPLTLGFRYRAEAKPAQIAFELRKPRVSAEVLATTEVREALIRSTWLIEYTIEYAGVDEFTVSVPKAIADEVQIDGAAIKERVKSEAKTAKGEPSGNVIWKITLQDKKLGDYELRVTYETPQTQLKQGSAVSVALPEIKPLNLFRETGQIAVIKDGNIEFTKTETKGLELMDPAELKLDMHRDGVFLAYKYATHPIVLRLDVAKNLFLEVPRALVTYAVFTSVIAENKAETTEAVYWVRNNSQQFLSVQLPLNGKMLSDAFVNGQPQQPSRRPDRNEMLIRLPAEQSGTAFPVRFVYEVPSANAEGGLSPRGSIPVEPPTLNNTGVLQSKWAFYLPGGYRYVKFGGPMREAATPWGWDVFRQLGDLFVPKLGPQVPVQNSALLNEPESLPTAKGGGFDFTLPKEGYSVTLRRLDAPARVVIHYRSRTYAAIVEAIALLGAFYLGARLVMRPRSTRFQYALGVGGGALIMAGAVAPRAAGFWTSIYLGVLGAIAVWVVAGIWRRIKGAPRIVSAVPAWMRQGSNTGPGAVSGSGPGWGAGTAPGVPRMPAASPAVPVSVASKSSMPGEAPATVASETDAQSSKVAEPEPALVAAEVPNPAAPEPQTANTPAVPEPEAPTQQPPTPPAAKESPASHRPRRNKDKAP